MKPQQLHLFADLPFDVGGNAAAVAKGMSLLIAQGLTEMGHKYRGDGRPHDTGLIRPYRPCPPDFRERFLEMGWDGIDEHYRTNWRVIRRWVEECGGDELRAERRGISGGTERPALRSRAGRYVLGLRMKAKVRP